MFDNVTFRYRRSAPTVLDAFTWTVPSGRTVLLGPNGAGKTTLLGLGADALRPQRGVVRFGSMLAGRRSDRSSFRSAIGWMPQQIRAVPGLTCQEQVAYAGWLKGLTRKDAWSAAASVLDLVDMTAHARVLASRLSGGQLRRVGLAQALVHRSRILLLDEPTVGLDPAQRAGFREIVRSLPGSLRAVVSTHQVDDLSEVFDTVVVLRDGHIRYQGTVQDFLALAPADAERPAEAAYRQVSTNAQ
jgi:ABC-2 type transport system ATP-binding protein